MPTWQAEQICASPARVLTVDKEALTWYSHILRPNSLNNTFLSQGYVTETAPSVASVGRRYIPKPGKEFPINNYQIKGEPAVMSFCWPPPKWAGLASK